MEDDKNQNLHFFEATTMRALYELMVSWQMENFKRFQSVSIQQDRNSFCAIAISNPLEVVISDIASVNFVDVDENGALCVNPQLSAPLDVFVTDFSNSQPLEVVISDSLGKNHADVDETGALFVNTGLSSPLEVAITDFSGKNPVYVKNGALLVDTQFSSPLDVAIVDTPLSSPLEVVIVDTQLSSPLEVVISDSLGKNHADVDEYGALSINNGLE